MKISSLFQPSKTIISFEFFPPKNDEDVAHVLATAGSLKPLNPSYISVTWGAGGGTRRKTLDLVSSIKNDVGIESMAHVTCVGAGRAEIDGIIDDIGARGIENILALRGDPPRGENRFVPHPDGFKHAAELVAHVRRRSGLCIGVAGYPEGHPECPDLDKDMDHLKRKVEQGADFIVTQLFFNPDDYFRFRDRAWRRGLRQPIVAGVMPVTNVGQIKRFTSLCGAKIPKTLEQDLERAQNDPETVVRLGVEHAVQQCRRLIEEGAPGIHFYTLNRSHATSSIVQRLNIRYDRNGGT